MKHKNKYLLHEYGLSFHNKKLRKIKFYYVEDSSCLGTQILGKIKTHRLPYLYTNIVPTDT